MSIPGSDCDLEKFMMLVNKRKEKRMGTDIHLFAEIFINGKWNFYGQIHMPRDYNIFNLMKNNPIGLPDNLSDITKMHVDEWIKDMHHASWYDINDIKILMQRIRKDKRLYYDKNWLYIFGHLFGNSYYNIKKYPDDYPDKITDCRFIFWFDN